MYGIFLTVELIFFLSVDYLFPIFTVTCRSHLRISLKCHPEFIIVFHGPILLAVLILPVLVLCVMRNILSV